MAYLVARTCTEVAESSGQRTSRNMEDLRTLDAYVLLGDPGSGKSETFREEAKYCGGTLVTARDFLTLPTKLNGNPVFIDGLDETRACEGDGRTPLDRMRERLELLGRPPFRLSCREADWLGSSDRHALMRVARTERVSVFHLDPLTKDQIREILVNDSSISNPDSFLEKAEERGLSALLQNPQTLRLLVEAVTDNQWPSTREDTFRLACEKLIMEPNVEHSTVSWARAPKSASLVEAGGALCAIQLLADVTGFTASGSSGSGFVSLRDLQLPGSLPLVEALKTRVFVGTGEGRFSPAHRSVAEYLAAHYLARVIERHSLPLGRALSLFSGADGGIVAGLRGLNAWLSVHYAPARRRLIEIDPLAVVLYGDTRLFSVEDKTAILRALHRQAKQYAGFRWQDWSAKPFGSLATPDMVGHLKAILVSPSREAGDQAFLDCVLDAVRYGDPLPDLGADLKAAAMDATRWPTIRSDALAAYMRVFSAVPQELRAIAEDIRDGKVDDPSDEMLGRLLHELFPTVIPADQILSYLHPLKDNHLIGQYYMFWSHKLSDSASDHDVAILLDAVAARTPVDKGDGLDLHVRSMVDGLLMRGIEVYGESVSDGRLYRWLGTTVDKHGFSRAERDVDARICEWLESRPERYKGLMSAVISDCTTSDNFRWCLHRGLARFHRARPPEDMGMWWLNCAGNEKNQERADFFFHEAIGLFSQECGHQGLSLEFFESWVDERPRFSLTLQRAMYEEIPDWRLEHAAHERKYKTEESERKAEWVGHFRELLPGIRTGMAPLPLFHDLARAYFGLLIEARGDSGLSRLSEFLDSDEELVSAALEGLKNCLWRVDCPTAKEIIRIHKKGRMHYLQFPFLAAMAELHRENPDHVLELQDDTISKLLAFYYAHGIGDDPAWFKVVVRSRPKLVADVFLQYVTAMLSEKKVSINGAYDALAYDEDFSDVARIVLVPLLSAFPQQARKQQVPEVLDALLKAALRYLSDDQLTAVIDEKLKSANLDVAQRVYWLACGLVVAPHTYHPVLARYVGKRKVRIQHLARFFSDRMDRWVIRDGTLESSLSFLIRVLGPSCSPDRPKGTHWVSPSMHTADFVRSLINRLSGVPSEAARQEIKKLLSEKTIGAWRSALSHAKHTQHISHREATFRHPTVAEVCQTLDNRGPANAGDLAALVEDHLRELAQEIRHGNTDQYKVYWNLTSRGRPTKPKPEDPCRDTLLAQLRPRLEKLGIDAQPEGHSADDKRSDIRVSYTAPDLSIGIPIEIKRNQHANLWHAIREQLIELYTTAPESKGRGIYLVFWFGEKGMPASPDGYKPTTALELESKLLATIPDEKRELISVVVMDCEHKGSR